VAVDNRRARRRRQQRNGEQQRKHGFHGRANCHSRRGFQREMTFRAREKVDFRSQWFLIWQRIF
jgi:hypothetical protein